MKYLAALSHLMFCSCLLFPSIVSSEETARQGAERPQGGWSSSARGGAVYQFDTDLDEGGSYSSTRYNIQAGQSYSWSRKDSVTLALSYGYDDYNFTDGKSDGIAYGTPWEGVHSISLSTPMRMGVSQNWSAFIIPSLRSTGESGADFSKTVTGGAFAGATYRFGKRLTIGPGIGVVTQLEESASIFPVLLINWKITDKFSLETGRGLAATLGPGLTLGYKASPKLKLAIGGRYEKLRFRLDEDGSVADGIGEDSSFPLFASCTYNVTPKASISLVGGLEIGGELIVENSKGYSIIEESSDPGVFTGATFNMRF